MRPILLRGHERSLTKVIYNRAGDLLLSTSKDSKPNVWYSHNGERLGTFNGHNGTVWDIDIDHTSKYAISAAADSTARLWDVYTGKQLFVWEFKAPARCASINEASTQVVILTDASMGQKSTLHFFSLKDLSTEPLKTIVISDSKATIARWGPLNKTLYTGHDDGTISIYSMESGKKLKSVKIHTGAIQDFQFSKDKTYFMTASKDNSSMMYDTITLKVMKTFKTERPVNSASISPIRNHIILGGGQEAMNVTTTSQRHEKFEVRFFHSVFEDEIGRCKGHFGPVNTLAFHPDGRSFASGGEDGYVRVHHFDDDYFEFKYDEEEFEEES